MVINLGTNDHLGANASTPKSKAFVTRYVELVVAASKAYGDSTRFFLACEPTEHSPKIRSHADVRYCVLTAL